MRGSNASDDMVAGRGRTILPLLELAAEKKFGLKIFAKAYCPLLLSIEVWSACHPELTGACATFTSNALELVSSNPDIKVVILAGL
jgi:hypothetical protein